MDNNLHYNREVHVFCTEQEYNLLLSTVQAQIDTLELEHIRLTKLLHTLDNLQVRSDLEYEIRTVVKKSALLTMTYNKLAQDQ